MKFPQPVRLPIAFLAPRPLLPPPCLGALSSSTLPEKIYSVPEIASSGIREVEKTPVEPWPLANTITESL